MKIIPLDKINNNQNIVKLNELINDYNSFDIKTPKTTKLNMLQRIDSLSRNILEDYRATKPNDESNKFYSWFKSDPLLGELRALCKKNENDILLNNQYLFELFAPEMQSSGYKAILDSFKKVEKNNNMEKSNIEIIDLTSIKNQLENLNTCKQHLQSGSKSTDIENYYQSLHKLKDKICSLRNDIPHNQGKNLCKQLDRMLQKVNSEAAYFASQNNLQKKEHIRYHKNPINEITKALCNGDQLKLVELFKAAREKTGAKKEFEMGKFKFKGLGGNNNQIWVATCLESAIKYTVRLEQCFKLPYKGMDREDVYQSANKHLEHNFETISLGKHKLNPNSTDKYECILAIGEFCPQGDLLSVVHNMSANERKKNFDKILNMVIQICEFNNKVIEAGYVYTDLKAENFLLRNDGTVITADLKSVIPLNDDGTFQKKLGACAAPMTVKLPYELQKQLDGMEQINPQDLSSYLIATIMNTLLCADKVEKKFGTHDQIDNGGKYQFDLNHEVYGTPEGLKVKELLKKIIYSEPYNRVSLDEMINEIKLIQESSKTNETKLMNISCKTKEFRNLMKMGREKENAPNEKEELENSDIALNNYKMSY